MTGVIAQFAIERPRQETLHGNSKKNKQAVSNYDCILEMLFGLS